MSATSTMWYLGLPFGILLHVAVLRKGEWDLAAHKILYCELLHLSLVFILVRYMLVLPDAEEVKHSMSFTALYAMMHAVGLLLSMCVYRLFFHRLRRFPGPVLGALSNFYVALSSLKRWRLYEDVQAMHAKYGDYVRVGPNELSISDSAAIPEIYGSSSPCNRGPLCNLSPKRYLYNFDRNKSSHQLGRKAWIRAFGARAIQSYDGTLEKHVRSLEDFLDVSHGKAVNVSDIMGFVSFDISFEAVYGKEAACMANGRQHHLMHTVRGLKTEIQPIQHLPWVVSLGLINPWPQGHYAQLSKQSNALVQEQLGEMGTREKYEKQGDGYKKAFEYFFHASEKFSDPEKKLYALKGDSDLALIAGWDNPANALVAVLYHLSQSCDHLALIREELHQKKEELIKSGLADAPEKFKIWANKLLECTNLTAAINEAMRLHPGLAQGVQRQTPPEGLQIGSTFIPGDVVITMPHHTLSHDARFFVDPDAFRPERWTTHRELVKDTTAFMPFGIGLSPCPGRLFAMRVMTVILADIALKWDFELAPGVARDVLWKNKIEKFNTAFGPVHMLFRRRT